MQGQGVGDRASMCTLILSVINRPALWVPLKMSPLYLQMLGELEPLPLLPALCFPVSAAGGGNQFKEWIFVQSYRL